MQPQHEPRLHPHPGVCHASSGQLCLDCGNSGGDLRGVCAATLSKVILAASASAEGLRRDRYELSSLNSGIATRCRGRYHDGGTVLSHARDDDDGGIAFRNQEELNEYLKMMEEAEKRDHRKIGKEMGLFMLCDEGPGFPFFLPKGMQLKNALIDYWRDIHYAADYVEVSTPMIMSRHLWETSGHWDHYKDNMYSTKIDDEDYCIKPMNCPGGVMVYRSQPHSYRDLPLRVGELGLVHRHELKGALHGLFRVRCFTQDDAHIFMTREQIPDEIVESAKLDVGFQDFMKGIMADRQLSLVANEKGRSE